MVKDETNSQNGLSQFLPYSLTKLGYRVEPKVKRKEKLLHKLVCDTMRSKGKVSSG